MRTNADLVSLALVLLVTTSALAQTEPTKYYGEKPAGAVAGAVNVDVPEAAQPAVDLVDAFGEALAAGDFEQVEAMLAPDVIVLESGGVESNRSEYLSHHARADARFLAGSDKELLQRRAGINGDMAWVASVTRLDARNDGEPLVLLSTETMVLKNTASGWRIVHIHWSSRPEESPGE